MAVAVSQTVDMAFHHDCPYGTLSYTTLTLGLQHDMKQTILPENKV